MLAFLSIKTRVRTECSGSFCVCSLYLVAAADGCGRLGRRPLEGGAVDRTCARWTGRGFRTGKSRTLFLCTTSSRSGFHSGPRFSDVLLVFNSTNSVCHRQPDTTRLLFQLCPAPFRFQRAPYKKTTTRILQLQQQGKNHNKVRLCTCVCVCQCLYCW